MHPSPSEHPLWRQWRPWLQSLAQRLGEHSRLLILGPLTVFALSYLVVLLFVPTRYSAEYIIAAEEEGSQAMESIMAQYGIDFEGGVKTSSIFRGESLVQLFQTRSMLERALRQKIHLRGEEKLAAAWFFPYSGHDWKAQFSALDFSSHEPQAQRLADSAIYLCYRYLLEDVLQIGRPEKRMSFIRVAAVHEDPLLASAFAQLLIETVSSYYIESKSHKARQNVRVLQNEMDSIQALLSLQLQAAALETDRNVLARRASLYVDRQQAIIDVEVTQVMFEQIARNLKLAQINLRKQTPMVELVQGAHFPLERASLAPWKWSALLTGVSLLLLLYWVLYGLRTPQP